MKNKINGINVTFFLALFLSIGNKTNAQNNENLVSPYLSGHYSPGFENIRDYADPAPFSGIMALDYNTYQFGHKFYDDNGQQVTKITGPEGTPIDLNIDMNGYINTPMLLWASKSKILGATYFGGLSIPIVTVSSALAYSHIGIIDSLHQSGNVSGKVTGFSDLNLMPIYLSWAIKNFNITVGYMVYAPTGTYTPGGSNNAGLGFWSNVIQVFTYWYPMKVKGKASQAMAIMFAPTLELTSKIKSTDVKPGNRFSLDYGISQYLSNNLSVGIYGGNDWQISQDKGTDVYWDPSIKDHLGVVGLELGYWLWTERLQAVGRYGINYGAVQRFEQNTIELNFIFITDILKGNKKEKTSSTE